MKHILGYNQRRMGDLTELFLLKENDHFSAFKILHVQDTVIE